MIFASETAAAVWKEAWCARCFQPDEARLRTVGKGRGCRVIELALNSRRVPVELVKSSREGLMRDAFRCSGFKDRPDVFGKQVAEDQSEVLF